MLERRLVHQWRPVLLALAALLIRPSAQATAPEAADNSIRQFLSQDNGEHAYHGIRRLNAENGTRRGWIEAATEFTPQEGFRYEITAEGGSSYIRTKVLRAVLEGERNLIARGDTARWVLEQSNYVFESDGVDADGLANIRLAPRREESLLVSGLMLLRSEDGQLVRLQGRLAKSPSFWVRTVHIVRYYDRIHGALLPVAMDSKIELRLLGHAALHISYAYSEVDGHPVTQAQFHAESLAPIRRGRS